MTYDADVVVIGLGALGSATAWQLARRGVSVLGLERFELGHLRGASHGDSRIIRLSYHTADYVANAEQAYRDWADLEADSGRSLVLRCGGIDVFPPGAAIPVDDYVGAMSARGVPFEVLDDVVTRRRWPAIAVPDGSTVLQQNETGIVPACLGGATMRERAVTHGARLLERFPVAELTADDDGVLVRCHDGSRLRARTAVVTADAWTNDVLAGLGTRIPLTVTKEHVVHFALGDGSTDARAAGDARAAADVRAAHAPGAFPVWIWMDDPSYYGFPSYGEPSVKVGQDCGGRAVDPDTRDFEPDADYVAAMREFVARTLPGVGAVSRVTTCLYTLTPDRDFVAALVPGQPRVAVGLGSAHGFKFAPWFGRVLADLATTGVTSSDIGAFTLDRPALTDPGAQQRWLV